MRNEDFKYKGIYDAKDSDLQKQELELALILRMESGEMDPMLDPITGEPIIYPPSVLNSDEIADQDLVESFEVSLTKSDR